MTTEIECICDKCGAKKYMEVHHDTEFGNIFEYLSSQHDLPECIIDLPRGHWQVRISDPSEIEVYVLTDDPTRIN